MGQAYCQSCCKVKNQPNTLQNEIENGDYPSHKFAKSVKQSIEVLPKTKQLYSKERTPHLSERPGVKLDRYYLFPYSAYYDGEWKDGLPHGFGTLTYDDGSIFEGCFCNGIAQCRSAIFIKENGTFYKGQVKNNRAQGNGILASDKMMYQGQWHNDLPHGEGQQIYSRVSYYNGSFFGGKKQGSGRYQWNNCQSYEGQFKQNKAHGYGKYKTKQYEYEGYFQNGEKSKSGILKNTLKKWEYEGQFKSNKMQGKGIYKWPDGTIFEGEFQQNNKKHGKLILVDGQTIQE